MSKKIDKLGRVTVIGTGGGYAPSEEIADEINITRSKINELIDEINRLRRKNAKTDQAERIMVSANLRCGL